ncbi:SN-glycerol-3-phosphate ABC superfamily ATP binding cassette transporter, ABC protein [Levilactobacillus koreensis JCM 16448]|uniref:Glycerol-3-phosphate ABC transporter ATP-binding protein n=1 Tax=Levilactobacillus koreensis TaxID=637971 RepID=A0AAC8UTS2_9LACO|nr:ABC transporter ATP-binding protein [Levilactobacillus koreensis]AKP64220.1 glycerol-3-phosphate ABC transporter ATP-binding protein [Levilactobacillus koreensis]KRK86227.1 SN-glycerol-3-phosphate ABC superfamily ATP binding cassette transporter, ABC protein [Levilactobacillus koreensis JCM 16448]
MSIELNALGKAYTADNWVLQNVTAHIESGEFFAIVGPSGCGKSTLLRMIAGLIPISTGELQIDGKVATDLPPKDRQLTMVFQSYALFPFLSVTDNVAFGLKARKFPAKEIEERVTKAIKLVNLEEFKDRRPRDLSGGQRQRVALARAIASDAKVCLMDEPLSNLDAQLRIKMRTELRNLQQELGLTVIYVTHDQVEAMTMADHIMVLHDHKIQQIGTPLDIYNRPANTFVASFFGTPRMNLLPARVTADRELTLADTLKLALPKPLPVADYIVGIRPTSLYLLPQGEGEPNAQVKTVEYLGAQILLEAELSDGTPIELTADPDENYQAGDWLSVGIDGNAYVFDHTGEVQFMVEGGRQHASRSHASAQA